MIVALWAAITVAGTCYAAPFSFNPNVDGAHPHVRRDNDTALSQPPLLPAIHWNHDSDDLQYLIPNTSHKLYYTWDGIADPAKTHMFASVHTNSSTHTIILDQTSHVEAVACQAGQLDITFTNEAAYEFAEQRWPSISDLVLATNSPTCGGLNDQRSFWAVSTLNFGAGLSLQVQVASEQSLQDDQQHRARDPVLSVFIAAVSLSGLISSAESFVSNVASSAASLVTTVASDALSAGQSLVSNVVNAINSVIDIPISVSADIPINVAPNNNVDDPFENSVLLASKSGESSSGAVSGEINIYCVNCYFSGDIQLAGQLEFDLSGITELQVSAMASFSAQLAIGIQATINIELSGSQTLFHATLPPPAGFSIPAIVSIGAFLDLSVEAEAMATVVGTALAGATLNIPQFGATLDFVDSSRSSTTPFAPQFNPLFQAEASIAASAGLSLPLAIGIGVTIPAISYSKSVAIVEQPVIEAALAADVSLSGSTSSCSGISYQIQFTNNIYIDAFDLDQFQLSSITVPVAQGCTSQSSRRSSNLFLASRPLARQSSNPPPISSTFFQYSSNETNVEEANGTEFTQLGWESGQRNSDSTGLWPNGTSFVSIKGATQPWMLVADEAGHLHPAELNVTSTGMWFIMMQGAIVADADARVLTYDSAMMERNKVSPLTLWTSSVWPGDDKAIALIPAATGSEDVPYVYVAANQTGSIFSLTTCNYPNQPSQLYLTADAKGSMEVLVNGTLPANVTAGDITSCVAIPWAVPQGALGAFA